MEKNKFSLEDFALYRSYWEEITKFILPEAQNKQSGILAERHWNHLLRSYSEHWRFYHTNRHVLSMLKEYTANREIYKLNKSEEVSLLVAIFFHDVVYRPDRNNNEEQSASLA